MIHASGIYKGYGKVQVLDNVSLDIQKSEIVSIVGASGAGKTTLLQILGTLDNPDKGAVSINGVNPFKLKPRELARFRNLHLGFVFQFHNLLAEFTATENVCIPALIAGLEKKEAEKKAAFWLERLGLSHRSEHKPSEMSGGEQQRVAVARALMNNPKVVFADEPSGNLDKANAVALHNLFFELRNEFHHSFVIVTHNEELASQADRKIVMSDGQII
jgi:lipoprotein-releasing system ATP-binding protein